MQVTDGEIALLAALVGAGAALIGSVLTLVYQDWQGRRTWRRDQRAQAALQFLREVRRVDLMLARYYRVGDPGDDLPEPTWRGKIAMEQAEIEVFSSKKVARAGQDVVAALYTLQDTGGAPGAMMALDTAVAEFREALQRDLGVKVTRLEDAAAQEVETLPYTHHRRSSPSKPPHARHVDACAAIERASPRGWRHMAQLTRSRLMVEDVRETANSAADGVQETFGRSQSGAPLASANERFTFPQIVLRPGRGPAAGGASASSVRSRIARRRSRRRLLARNTGISATCTTASPLR